jgi:putative membrane protein
MYWYGSFIGMSWLWWVFWGISLVVFFSLLTPVPRSRVRLLYEDPFDILRRRYAAGQITTAEYEERRAGLRRDAPVQPSVPGSMFHPTADVPADRRRAERRHMV